MSSRETQIVPLVNGAMLYLTEGGRPTVTLTFADTEDAKIVARTWVDSIPPVVRIPQPTLSCEGRFDGVVTDKTKCLYCGKKWIEH